MQRLYEGSRGESRMGAPLSCLCTNRLSTCTAGKVYEPPIAPKMLSSAPRGRRPESRQRASGAGRRCDASEWAMRVTRAGHWLTILASLYVKYDASGPVRAPRASPECRVRRKRASACPSGVSRKSRVTRAGQCMARRLRWGVACEVERPICGHLTSLSDAQ